MSKPPRLPKGCVADFDRHGNMRIYLRRAGRPKYRFKAKPGTNEFHIEYGDVLAGRIAPLKPERKPRIEPGSVRAAITAYISSIAFKTLSARTQHVRRNILDGFCQRPDGAGGHLGDLPLSALGPAQIRRFQSALADRPEAANALVKALRAVMSEAVRADIVVTNAAAAVAYLPPARDGGFPAWTDADVEAFERAHPPGSMARLALRLFQTGQRLGDVARLGPRNVDGEHLRLKQQKTGAELTLPIPVTLRTELDLHPPGETFLLTEFGKPFSVAGLGNRFRKWCDEAGLTGISAHGLRKWTAAALAEAGATEKEISAVTGHASLKEVVRYTRSANQRKLADRAFAKMASASSVENVPPKDNSSASGTNPTPTPLKNKEKKGCMVPRGGIEPPTLRFSVACSTN